MVNPRFVPLVPLVVTGLVTFALPLLSAQAPPVRKAFEAATIRQNKEPGLGNNQRLPGGRFVATKTPLRGLLRMAYGNATIFRAQQQIIGAPGWIDTERFDIEGTAGREFVADADGVVREHLEMLRTLLEERFALKASMQKRTMPYYALVRLHDDRYGPQLAETRVDCSPGAPAPADGRPCGVTNLGPGKGNFGRGVRINILLTLLNISPAVDRVVYDHTGLTGLYDMTFYFAPPVVIGPSGAVPNPDVDAGPTVFTALQEQLGLKLEPRTGPVDVLVVDHIERLSDRVK